MIYDFYLCTGKENTDPEFEGLQKCSIVFTRLSKNLHNKSGHKLYFENWFMTLALLHYLKSKNVFAVGIIRVNRLLGCPLSANKDLSRGGRGLLDYRVDSNSGIAIAKW